MPNAVLTELVKNLIISSPSLVGGIVVLILMLKHTSGLQKANMEIAKTFVEAVKSQATQCHEVQKESVEVMRQTSTTLATLTANVKQSDVTLREVREVISRYNVRHP